MRLRAEYFWQKGRYSEIMMTLLAFAGYWAYRYYGDFMPEIPDDIHYETMEQRAEAAMAYVQKHNLNQKYCLFVDYSIPSGTPRLFVWSFRDSTVVASTYDMHGYGMGSTAEKPVFSNKPGCRCSSLGRFAVTKRHGAKLKRSYRLRGVDTDNKTAGTRGLMIHRSSWVDTHCHKDYIPLHPKSCEGCITVSSRGMTYLEKLINSQEKNLLLWSYY